MRERDLKGLAGGTEERSARLAASLADAAADRGLLSVATGEVDSPIGRLTVAVTKRGLLRVAFPHEGLDRVMRQLADRVSPRILRSARATEEVRRELAEFFEGRRRRFDVDLDMRLIEGFQRTTLRATARIPFGSVRTYGELAREVGRPRAARAVGNAVGANPIPIVIPCHRVVRAGGALGGYGGGVERKVALLELEGSLPLARS